MNKLKPIALYLPQYHPIPENDEWWGKGFTEWVNVAKSRPKFNGHYQPHVPKDLGFYDLRVSSVMEEQAALAKRYGVHGFCFYHYWFNGKLLLESPLENMLKSGKPDMPYCLCWANENWTRRWDGQEAEVLMEQSYNLQDEEDHIRYLLPFFKDERYIKVEGKPVFLMYRTELHPFIAEAAQLWRKVAREAGFPDLYLIRIENFERNTDPGIHGFDAGAEFAPDGLMWPKKKYTKAKFGTVGHFLRKRLHKYGVLRNVFYENNFSRFPVIADNMMKRQVPDYEYFRCIAPSWDNSARRQQGATIHLDPSPELFRKWTSFAANYTLRHFGEEKQFFFINAWNEWGEGCHLEPDQKYGHAYLEALREGLSDIEVPASSK